MNPSSLQFTYEIVSYSGWDRYQIPLALLEANAFAGMFTDFYTPDWLWSLIAHFDGKLKAKLEKRHHPLLSSRYFHTYFFQHALKKNFYQLGQTNRTEINRRLDNFLGQAAASKIRNRTVGVLAYSYYWLPLAKLRATNGWDGPAVVFQVHPVAPQIRRILHEDRQKTGLTYSPEDEELSSIDDSVQYVESLKYCSGILAASSFTARGLIQEGISKDKIAIVPYGADKADEAELPHLTNVSDHNLVSKGPLKLLWVGQLAYRKAPHHLFNAIRQFSPSEVQLTIVTRSDVPAELSKLFPANAQIVRAKTNAERDALYKTHHLFVMPSLVEGFGLVYLEALSHGLPVLCSINSGGIDIITDNVEGFIVEPGDSSAIVEKIDYCLRNRDNLSSMSVEANQTIRRWTWERYQSAVISSLAHFEMLETTQKSD
jgi:glycosyltransferase involved in cell wall biosynthesis